MSSDEKSPADAPMIPTGQFEELVDLFALPPSPSFGAQFFSPGRTNQGRGQVHSAPRIATPSLDKPQYLTLLNAIANQSLPGLVIQALLQFPDDPYVLIKSFEAMQGLCQHNPALLEEFLLLGTFDILREAVLAHVQVKEVLLVAFRVLQTVCEGSAIARSTFETELIVTALSTHPDDLELHVAGLLCLSVLLNGPEESAPPFVDSMVDLYLRVFSKFPQSAEVLRLAILGLGHAFNTSQRWRLFRDRVPELVSMTIKQCTDKSLMDLYHPISSLHLALEHPQFGDSNESLKVLDFAEHIDEFGIEGEPLLSVIAARAAAQGSDRDFTLLELLVACGASLDKLSPLSLKSVRQLYCQQATRHNRVREAIGRGLDREAKSRASLAAHLSSQTKLPQPLMNMVTAYIGIFTQTPFIRSLYLDWDCPVCTFHERARKTRPKLAWDKKAAAAAAPARTVCSCCQTELVGFVDPEARSKLPRWEVLLHSTSIKAQHEAAQAWLTTASLDQDETEAAQQLAVGDSWDVEFSASLDRSLFFPDSLEFARVFFESINRPPPQIYAEDESGDGDEGDEHVAVGFGVFSGIQLGRKRVAQLAAHEERKKRTESDQQESEEEEDPDIALRKWSVETFPMLAVDNKLYTQEQQVEVATSQLPLTVLNEVGENQWRSTRTVGLRCSVLLSYFFVLAKSFSRDLFHWNPSH